MKLLTVAIMTLATTAAYAKSNTEYYFQPAAGQSALTAAYLMSSTSIKADNAAATETKMTGSDVALDYGYGLTESSTVGGYLFSGSMKTEQGAAPSTTANGMSDLHVYYRAFSNIWHYGADLGVNMGKAKADARSTGGMSVKVNAGALLSSDAWNYGGDLALTFPMERTTEVTGGDTKTTGGMATRVAAFGEYNYGMGFVGAELAQNMVAKTTDKTVAGVETETASDNFLSVMPYASYDFSDMVTGLLSYEMDMHGSRTGVKAYTTNVIALGARFNF